MLSRDFTPPYLMSGEGQTTYCFPFFLRDSSITCMMESFESCHVASPCSLLLCLVRLRICVSPGRSFLTNYVSRFASGTESGAGRILEPKPNLSRNHFSSNLISGSANIMPSPTYISLWYFSRSFPQVLKRQSVDRVPCPLSFDTSFLSS